MKKRLIAVATIGIAIPLGLSACGKSPSASLTVPPSSVAPVASQEAQWKAFASNTPSASLTWLQNPILIDKTSGVPVIGTVKTGQVLAVSMAAKAVPDEKITYTYQWKEGETYIAGATNSTYTPDAGMKGQQISVIVSATTMMASPLNATTSTVTVLE